MIVSFRGGVVWDDDDEEGNGRRVWVLEVVRWCWIMGFFALCVVTMGEMCCCLRPYLGEEVGERLRVLRWLCWI